MSDWRFGPSRLGWEAAGVPKTRSDVSPPVAPRKPGHDRWDGFHARSPVLVIPTGGVEVINDSGWLFVGGFQVLVDNVSYGGATVSSPPPPVLGESVGLTRVSGQVIARYPGRRRRGQIVRLEGTAPLPVGTVIDSLRVACDWSPHGAVARAVNGACSEAASSA
jgi:hypothetical protein